MRNLAPLVLLLACHKDDTDTSITTGDGLFDEGCPTPGGALARVISVDAKLPGAVAVGTRGDFLLANEHAAFVITRPDANATYWYYGGALADAVAMEGCAPTADDGLDEIGLVLTSLDITSPNESIVRGFRADRVEVLADGSDGGPAIVRATGTDDQHWLADDELIRSLVNDGGGRAASAPWGLDLTVDYVLEPDSPVVRIDFGLANPSTDEVQLATAALVSFAPAYDIRAYATSSVDLGFFAMDTGIPYLTATGGSGAYAYAVDHGNLGHTHLAGIDISIDLDQAITDPIHLTPGASDARTTWFAVSGGDSAAADLLARAPDVLPDATASAVTIRGTVNDDAGPVAGATVELQADGGEGYGALDVGYTDADGRFALTVPRMSPTPWTFRAVAREPGRDEAAPIAVDPDGGDLAITMGGGGTVSLAITDDLGPVPARVVLRRDDGKRIDLWTAGTSDEPVPPGHYTWTATRGFEYEPVAGAIDVPPGSPVRLTATLQHVVDTTGFVSLDTHVHSAHSPDSRMLPQLQMLHAAAHGVDVVVHTEHEVIADQSADIALAGLTGRVAQISGEEVTATIPEHMTMFPAQSDGTPRGGPVRWYGLDLTDLFAAMRARSDGGINIFNHPGYMDLVGWDVVTATPTLDDPTRLGLAADADLWSWDFDGIEVMNSFRSPFADGNHRFDLWQSLLNAGHRVTATGCSDDHGGDETGYPRVYVAAPEDLAHLDEPAIVDAFRGGRAVVSGGAFARVSIDDQGPGALVAATGEVMLHVHVEAPAAVDVTKIVVFANCDEVASLPATAPNGVVKFDGDVALAISGDTHVTVAAFGEGALPDGLPQFSPTSVPRALTNPIYLDANANGVFDAPGGRICNYDL